MFKKKTQTEEAPTIPGTFPKLPRLPPKQVEEEEQEEVEQEQEEEQETPSRPKGVTVDQIVDTLINQEQRLEQLEAAFFRLKSI